MYLSPVLPVVVGFLALTGLAVAQASPGALVAIDSSRAISRIDPATGSRVVFKTATSNASTTAGLAYDFTSNLLYTTSTGNDSLFTLDVNTGAATLVGVYSDTSVVMHGIEIDMFTGQMYGASGGGTNFNFYRIDKNTGALTLVGPLGLTSFTNLVFDPTTNTMFATNSGTDSWYSVNLATGAATLIGPLNGPTNPNGLAYDLSTNTIYLVCNNTDTLYTVDRVTGSATAIGLVGSSNLLGLAMIPHSGTYATFGTGCPGTLGVPGNLGVVAPAAGQTMVASFTALPFDLAVVLVGFSNTFATGFGPLPIDLGVLGAPGCTGRVSPDQSYFVVGSGNVAQLNLMIPDNPALFVGFDFFTQALVFDNVNAFGFTLSDAAITRIGI